jgi:surface polysaccharide O-acyltransferase-like enzyme
MDSMRAVAALAVLLIHFCSFPTPAYEIVQVLVRFAVPFFFISSGYFFAVGVEKNGLSKQVLQTCRKLTTLYIIWWVIYFIFPSSAEIRNLGFFGSYLARFEKVTANFENFVFFGPTVHLWYFPSLICAVVTAFFLLKYVKMPLIRSTVAVTTYVLGLLGGSYAVTKVGLQLPFNHRHIVFFSLLPFYLGMESAKRTELDFKCRRGLFLFAIGALGHFVEAKILFVNFERGMQSHDYLASTLIMAYGAFIIAMTNSKLLENPVLRSVGRLAGGTYVVHILVLQRIPYIEPFMAPDVWKWTAPFLAYLVSAFIAAGMLRIPFIKRTIPA